MVGLPEQFNGILRYNGFEFPPAIRARVQMSAVQDSSGRYTKYTQYRIQVETVIHEEVDQWRSIPTADPPFEANPNQLFLPGEPIDGIVQPTGAYSGMTGLRNRLSSQGGELVFIGKGYGADLVINTANPQHGDVLYGPRPQEMLWEPIGANQAVRIIWTVELTIADCGVLFQPVAEQPGRIAEYTTEWGWDIDDHGVTTRTVSGMIEVANAIITGGSNQRRNQVTAEQYRINVAPLVLPGFRRTTNNFVLQPNRNVATFRYVDEEYEGDNALHPQVVRADISATVRNRKPLVFTSWLLTMSGTISVSKAHPRYFAWVAFLAAVRPRLEAAKGEGSRPKPASGNVMSPGETEKAIEREKAPMLWVRNLSIRESLYGRDMSFSITWRLEAREAEIIKASGLWKPPARTQFGGAPPTWQEHANEMNRTAWFPTGVRGLRHNINNDFIRSLCQPRLGSPGEREGEIPANRFIGDAIFQEDCSGDYYDVETWIEVEEETQSVRMSPLGGQSPVQSVEWRNVVDQNPDQFAPIVSGSTAGVAVEDLLQPVVQTRGNTQTIVVFKGMATRCGKTPVIPRLLRAAGVEVERAIGRARSAVRTKSKGDANNKPHYTIYWSQRYQMKGPLKGDVRQDVAPNDIEFPD